MEHSLSTSNEHAIIASFAVVKRLYKWLSFFRLILMSAISIREERLYVVGIRQMRTKNLLYM